jgi:hypothetical protein
VLPPRSTMALNLSVLLDASCLAWSSPGPGASARRVGVERHMMVAPYLAFPTNQATNQLAKHTTHTFLGKPGWHAALHLKPTQRLIVNAVRMWLEASRQPSNTYVVGGKSQTVRRVTALGSACMASSAHNPLHLQQGSKHLTHELCQHIAGCRALTGSPPCSAVRRRMLNTSPDPGNTSAGRAPPSLANAEGRC